VVLQVDGACNDGAIKLECETQTKVTKPESIHHRNLKQRECVYICVCVCVTSN